jgi:hypothetical protein
VPEAIEFAAKRLLHNRRECHSVRGTREVDGGVAEFFEQLGREVEGGLLLSR